MIIGANTRFMGETHIVAAKLVSIGRNCAVSWNTQIMDTDFHHILLNGECVNDNADVVIGDHVWVGSHSLVLKGTVIPEGVVVAAGSVINHKDNVIQPRTIITGLPNKVLKENIDWKM